MKGEFIEYLKSLGMTEILQQRVSSIYDFFQQVCPEPIIDIFVNDYVKEDGSREYESLWFFSKSYVMSTSPEFATSDKFDMANSRKKVVYWIIEKRDYDFKKATEKSRLNLKYTVCPIEMQCELKASKENCDYLRKIFHTYILSNIIE